MVREKDFEFALPQRIDNDSNAPLSKRLRSIPNISNSRLSNFSRLSGESTASYIGRRKKMLYSNKKKNAIRSPCPLARAMVRINLRN